MLHLLLEFSLDIKSEIFNYVSKDLNPNLDFLDAIFKFIIIYAKYECKQLENVNQKIDSLSKKLAAVILNGTMPIFIGGENIIYFYSEKKYTPIKLEKSLITFFEEYSLFSNKSKMINTQFTVTKSIVDLYKACSGKSYKSFEIANDLEEKQLNDDVIGDVSYFEMLLRIQECFHLINIDWVRENNITNNFYNSCISLADTNFDIPINELVSSYKLKKIQTIILRSSIKNIIYANLSCVASYLSLNTHLRNQPELKNEVDFSEKLIEVLLSGGLPISWSSSGKGLEDGEFIVFYSPEYYKDI